MNPGDPPASPGQTESPVRGLRGWWKVVAIYALVGFVWVYTSDRLVGWLPLSPSSIPRWRIASGWIFVAITSLVLFRALRRFAVQLEDGRATLARSEEQFRTLVESAPDAIVVESRGLFAYINPAGVSLLGASSDRELLDKPVVDRFRETSRDEVRELMRALKEDGRSLAPSEAVVLRLDGTEVHVEISAVPFVIRGERGALVLARDITHRKRMENALLESEADRRRAEQGLQELTGRLFCLQDQERRRLARELHDTTAQDMTAIGLGLTRVLQLLAVGSKEEARSMVSDCMQLVEASGRDVRTLSYFLHPPLLDELGLPAALREFVEELGRRKAMPVEFHCSPDFGRVGAPQEMALFRIAQESLGNARRRAGPGSVTGTLAVVLRRENGMAHLEVSGCGGANPTHDTKAPSSGDSPGRKEIELGIAGMRERMRQLGGELEVETFSDRGVVRARVPAMNAKDAGGNA